MSDTNDAILQAIQSLSDRMDEGFDRIEHRVRKTESDIIRFKTVSAVLASIMAFFGWPAVKAWLTSLMK